MLIFFAEYQATQGYWILEKQELMLRAFDGPSNYMIARKITVEMSENNDLALVLLAQVAIVW
jgi:hypothetical protein